jgi:hypothetical protein
LFAEPALFLQIPIFRELLPLLIKVCLLWLIATFNPNSRLLAIKNKDLIHLAFLAPVHCRPDKVSALFTMAAKTITNLAAIAPEYLLSAYSRHNKC